MGNGIADDDLVTTANISGVTSLTVSSLGIIDLSGIEDFTALQYLWCDGNVLTALDVTQNTNLLLLACGNVNHFTSLDVTKNTLLTNLSINFNVLMTSIDVTKNLALKFLNTQNVPLTSLDVTKNIALEELNVQSNSLTSLDVSQNVALWNLDARGNQISSLELSKNSVLFIMHCNNNTLLELNVKNNYNDNVPNSNFNALNNPGLTCITVDDVTYSTNNWTNIDGGVTYSTGCPPLSIEDFNVSSIKLFPNPAKDKVIISLNSSASYSLVSLLGQEIQKGAFTFGDNALDISALSKGLYLLNVKTSQGIVTKKIIKQ